MQCVQSCFAEAQNIELNGAPIVHWLYDGGEQKTGVMASCKESLLQSPVQFANETSGV